MEKKWKICKDFDLNFQILWEKESSDASPTSLHPLSVLGRLQRWNVTGFGKIPECSSIRALESRIHTVWAKTTGHWAHLASTNSCPKAVLPGDQGLDWFSRMLKNTSTPNHRVITFYLFPIFFLSLFQLREKCLSPSLRIALPSHKYKSHPNPKYNRFSGFKIAFKFHLEVPLGHLGESWMRNYSGLDCRHHLKQKGCYDTHVCVCVKNL